MSPFIEGNKIWNQAPRAYSSDSVLNVKSDPEPQVEASVFSFGQWL